jgi:hypothetical protein
LAVFKYGAEKTYFGFGVAVYNLLYFGDYGRIFPFGNVEIYRHVFAVLACRNGFQVVFAMQLHQCANGNFHAVVVANCQTVNHIADGLLLAANH